MEIHIDLAAVPPTVALEQPDDFKAFKVVVQGAEHAYVQPSTLLELAGAQRADDPAWRADLDKMLAFAGEHGWVRDDGAVRAHVESAP